MHFRKLIAITGFVTLFTTNLFSQVNILSQGFEALPFPPTGWSNVRLTGPSFPGNWARFGNGVSPVQTPHTGSWQIRFNSANFGAGTSGELRTNVQDFTTAGTYTVSFWMYRDNWVGNDKLEVFVNTAQTSIGGTLLGTINRDRAQSPAEGSNGWYKYTFTIPSTFNTATNYVIFKATSAFGKDIYLDDLSIDRLAAATPGCVTSFVPASGSTGICTNETLTWDIVPLASGYKISAGNNAPDYNNVANNIDLAVALNYTNIFNPSTTYGWKVTPYNGYGEATGCPVNTFTTGSEVCYCTPVYLEGSCGSEDFIDDFSTTGGVTNITNNNTGCTTNPNNYTHFAAQNLTIAQGAIFNVSMQSGPEFTEGFAIWIDYNIDGDFDDAGEYVFNSVTATIDVVNGSITIPYSAAAGNTRMRIRCAYNYVPTSGTACATFNNGETEDYNVTITACSPVTYYADSDADNFGNAAASASFCTPPVSGYVLNNTDCNDGSATIYPGATEICNGIDDDCDATNDDGLTFITYYADADGDLFGNNLISTNTCSGAPSGYVNNNTDCNDANASIKPGATEICNAIDDDCDASTDEGLIFITYYADADGDTYGNNLVTSNTCSGAPTGFVINNTDCNDANASIKPGATEICNTIDDDCDASIDEGVVVAVITPSGPTSFCSPGTVTLQATTGAGYTYQWLRNGGNIGGATSANYTTNKSGNYQVKVSVAGGCTLTSSITAVNVIAAPKATITAPGGTDLCGLPSLLLKTGNGAGYTFQWIKNGANIAGATSNTYTVTTIGNYKVKVTNASGCAKVSATTAVTKSCKMEGGDATISLGINPNPASDLVQLYIQNETIVNQQLQIEIFNVAGQLINTSHVNMDGAEYILSLDINTWPAGMYLVKVTTEGYTTTQQLVISR